MDKLQRVKIATVEGQECIVFGGGDAELALPAKGFGQFVAECRRRLIAAQAQRLQHGTTEWKHSTYVETKTVQVTEILAKGAETIALWFDRGLPTELLLSVPASSVPDILQDLGEQATRLAAPPDGLPN